MSIDTDGRDVFGVPHRLLDHVLEARAMGQLSTSQALLISNLADTGGNLLGDATEFAHAREQDTLLQLVLGRHVGNGHGSLHEHLASDTGGARGGDGQAQAGKRVGVVQLVDLADLALVLNVLEGASTGENGPAISPLESLLGCALGLAGGVGEREDNGLFDTVGHGANGTLREDTGSTAETQDDSRLDGLDDLLEGHAVLHVLLSVADLALVQLGAFAAGGLLRAKSAVTDQAMLVEHPDAAVGLLARLDLALLNHAVNDTLADTDTGTSGTNADDALVTQIVEGLTTSLQGSENTSQGNGGGGLDIIVEAADLVLVLVEKVVSVLRLEILELNEGIRVSVLDGVDPLVDERVVLLTLQAAVTHSEIERVIQELLVICADVQHDRENRRRTNSTTSDVL